MSWFQKATPSIQSRSFPAHFGRTPFGDLSRWPAVLRPWAASPARAMLAMALTFILGVGTGVIPLLALQSPAVEFQDVLDKSWESYKRYFIQHDGRVIDFSARSLSTSEGQSYALLRAVWMKDKDLFDRVYAWTQKNLQTRKDKLFAWQWGQDSKTGTWGVLDDTTAADADEDIALALLMAHRLWGEEHYKTEAVKIIGDIWEVETLDTPIGRVLLPGDWKQEVGKTTVQINPSYMAPYAYRVFAGFDTKHNWMSVVDSSYQVLETASQQTGTHLPPDWIELDVKTGKLELYGWEDPMDKRSDYGYEAIRCHWRVVLDYLMNPQEERARKWLTVTNWYLVRHWRIRNTLPGIVTLDGIERDLLSSNAIYGTLLPALSMGGQREVADVILERFILSTLNPHTGLWEPRGDYYAQNWLWMGYVVQQYYATHGLKTLSGKEPGTEVLERLTFLLGY